MAHVPQAHPFRREVTLLLQAAMLVFVWTVVIGILNGTDVVVFGRRAVLSHVHAGTLGWITMCVFAAALWLFGQGEGPGPRTRLAARALTVAAIVVLPAFAFTFALTFGVGRAHMGGLAAAVIAGFFVLVLTRVRKVELSVTHLGFLAAVATSVAGAVLGVLLATKIATGHDVVPKGVTGAHPGTMVVGFLIPVGMALAEWCFRWGNLTRATRLGVWQIATPFVGGLLLMVGLLFEITPLPPIATLIELGGVVIFVIRVWPFVRRVDWLSPSLARFAAASSIAIVANIIYINVLAGRYKGDFDVVPTHLLLALDHMMFIGVLTNALFGLLLGVTGVDRRFRLANQAVFFGMNVGIVGFVIGLLLDVTALKRIFTPLMGAAILVALVVQTYRLWAVKSVPEPIREAATAPAGG